MKKIGMIMAVLALTLTANAQKFGDVNTQEMFMLMPELKDGQARMDSLNKQNENTLRPLGR